MTSELARPIADPLRTLSPRLQIIWVEAAKNAADDADELRDLGASAMAKIIEREVRRRGFFGKLWKGLFIVFNVLMGVWVVGYTGQC